MPTDLTAIRERHYPMRMAGREWCHQCSYQEWPCDTAQVLAALGAGIDVERLAKAMRRSGYWYWNDPVDEHAARVAAEYAALADTGIATFVHPRLGTAELRKVPRDD